MLIRELRLLNFRNYKTLSVQFDPQINIFAGYNAQGKTNILEAIYLLAMGRSFRAVKDSEMITHDQSYSLVSGQVTTEATHTLELVLKRSGPKQFRFNKRICLTRSLSAFSMSFCSLPMIYTWSKDLPAGAGGFLIGRFPK